MEDDLLRDLDDLHKENGASISSPGLSTGRASRSTDAGVVQRGIELENLKHGRFMAEEREKAGEVEQAALLLSSVDPLESESPPKETGRHRLNVELDEDCTRPSEAVNSIRIIGKHPLGSSLIMMNPNIWRLLLWLRPEKLERRGRREAGDTRGKTASQEMDNA